MSKHRVPKKELWHQPGKPVNALATAVSHESYVRRLAGSQFKDRRVNGKVISYDKRKGDGKTNQLYIKAAYQFTADKTNVVELHVRSIKDGWVPLDGCPLCLPPPPESDDVAAAPVRPHPQLLPLVISQPRLHKLQQHLLQQNKPLPNQGDLHE